MRSRGVVFSGSVLLELAQKGVTREQAYEWVQRNAMRSFAEQVDFKLLLLADRDVTAVLSAAEIERAFDLDEQLRHVDHGGQHESGHDGGVEQPVGRVAGQPESGRQSVAGRRRRASNAARL